MLEILPTPNLPKFLVLDTKLAEALEHHTTLDAAIKESADEVDGRKGCVDLGWLFS